MAPPHTHDWQHIGRQLDERLYRCAICDTEVLVKLEQQDGAGQFVVTVEWEPRDTPLSDEHAQAFVRSVHRHNSWPVVVVRRRP